MASENLDIIIRADASDAQRDIKGVESTMSKLGKAATILSASIATSAVVFGTFAKKAITAAAGMETQAVAFKTLLGSADKAQSFMQELQEFATKTPFEFKGLASTSQQLLNMGFKAEQVIPIMTRVGDAVSAAGGDPMKMESTVRALTQIQAKGKLSAEEMMQLAEAGTFSWTALASTLGVTVAEAMDMTTKGRISSQQAIDAFMENSKNRFDGAMADQSKTFSGLMSTLSDSWNMFLQGQGAKLLDWAKVFVTVLIDFINNDLPVLIERFEKWAKVVTDFLPSMDQLKTFFGSLGDVVRDTAKRFEEKTGLVSQLREAFGKLWATIQDTLIPSLQRLWEAMQPLMPFFEMLATFLATVFVITLKVLIEVLVVVVDIFVRLLAIVIDVVTWVQEFMNPAIEFATKAFGKLAQGVQWVIDKFNSMKAAAKAALEIAGSAISMVGSIPGAGIIASTLLPGRATGGPVTGGQAYMVGERGPEMFVPRGSGSIVPNHDLGSATQIHIMEGASVSVGNQEDINALADAVSTRLARVLQQQRSGLATSM